MAASNREAALMCPDNHGNVPILLAVASGSIEHIAEYVNASSHQTDIFKIITDTGDNILHISATSSVEIAELICTFQGSCDFRLKNALGMSPLDICIKNRRDDIAEVFSKFTARNVWGTRVPPCVDGSTCCVHVDVCSMVPALGTFDGGSRGSAEQCSELSHDCYFKLVADVVGLVKVSGPDVYERLTKAGRMQVAATSSGHNSVRLKALRYKEPGHAILASISWDDLNKLLESNASEMLKSFGAIDLGTAEEILNVTNKTKNQLAMVSPQGNHEAMFAAYALTRILPLMKNYGLAQVSAI
jgi:hypothetical protein